MDYQVTDSTADIDLPELLAQSGLVSSHDLSEAIQVSKRLQTPVSRVLMTSNCIDQGLLDMSNELQALVSEQFLTREEAYGCLRRLAARETTSDDLLDEIYSSPRFAQNTKLMADLVRRSGIVPQLQLDRVLQGSSKAGYSLKSALISEGILSAAFFPAVLRLQEKLRKGRVNMEQAAEQLKTEYAFWLKAEESQRFATFQSELLSEPGGRHPGPHAKPGAASTKEAGDGQKADMPTLTHFLEASGFLKKKDLQTAYDRLLANPHLSAHVFETLGLLKPEDLATVLECHALVSKGHLASEQAIQALKISRTKKVRLKRALEELSGWSAVQARAERRSGLIAGFAVGCVTVLAGVALSHITKGIVAQVTGLFSEQPEQLDADEEEIP